MVFSQLCQLRLQRRSEERRNYGSDDEVRAGAGLPASSHPLLASLGIDIIVYTSMLPTPFALRPRQRHSTSSVTDVSAKMGTADARARVLVYTAPSTHLILTPFTNALGCCAKRWRSEDGQDVSILGRAKVSIVVSIYEPTSAFKARG